MTKEKKFALVLSGGGFKGAFELGALKYIDANWQKIGLKSRMHYDIVAGVSVGALNGAMVASNKFDDLKDLWIDKIQNKQEIDIIYTSEFVECNGGKINLKSGFIKALRERLFPSWTLAGVITRTIFSPGKVEAEFQSNLPNLKSIADNEPLYNTLKAIIDINNIPDTTIYNCGFVSLDDGNYYSIRKDKIQGNNETLIKAIWASASMPVTWAPISTVDNIKNATNCVDGGVTHISPLYSVIDYISKEDNDSDYEIHIINCSSEDTDSADTDVNGWNIGSIANRSVDIMTTEIINTDIKEFLRVNELVKQVIGKTDQNGNPIVLNYNGNPLKYFTPRLICPDVNTIGSTLDSSSQTIAKRIELGYKKAEDVFTSKGPKKFGNRNIV